MAVSTDKKWAAQLLADPDVFDSIVAPYLFPGDYSRFWQKDDNDTKDLYKGVSESTGSSERLVAALGRRKGLSLTYGEVTSSSVLAHVWPGLLPGLLPSATGGLPPSTAPVFADLGSGTGKIPMQVYFLYTAEGLRREAEAEGGGVGGGVPPLPPITCLGLELGTERHLAGAQALAAAAAASPTALAPFIKAALSSEAFDDGLLSVRHADGSRSSRTQQEMAAVLAQALTDMPRHVQLHKEDILQPTASAWPTRVTAVFVNNRVFEESLMSALACKLAESAGRPGAPGPLRALALILPLCTRHRERCITSGSSCAAFHAAAVPGYCNPSWCDSCSLWWYYPAARAHPGCVFPSPIPHAVGAHVASVAAGAGGDGVMGGPASPVSPRSSLSPARTGASGGPGPSAGAGGSKQGAQRSTAGRAASLLLPSTTDPSRASLPPGRDSAASATTPSSLRMSRLALGAGGDAGAGAGSPNPLLSSQATAAAAAAAATAAVMGPPPGATTSAPLSARSYGASSSSSGARWPVFLPEPPLSAHKEGGGEGEGEGEQEGEGKENARANRFGLVPPPPPARTSTGTGTGTGTGGQRVRRSSSARSEQMLLHAMSGASAHMQQQPVPSPLAADTASASASAPAPAGSQGHQGGGVGSQGIAPLPALGLGLASAASGGSSGGRFMYQASPCLAVDSTGSGVYAPRASPVGSLGWPSASPVPAVLTARLLRSSTTGGTPRAAGGGGGGGDGYTTPIHQMIRTPTEPPGAPKRPKAMPRTGGRGGARGGAQAPPMAIPRYPLDELLQMNVDVEPPNTNGAPMPSPARASVHSSYSRARGATTASSPLPLLLVQQGQGQAGSSGRNGAGSGGGQHLEGGQGPVAVRPLASSQPRPMTLPAPAAGSKRGHEHMQAAEEDQGSSSSSSGSSVGSPSTGGEVGSAALSARPTGGAFMTLSPSAKRKALAPAGPTPTPTRSSGSGSGSGGAMTSAVLLSQQPAGKGESASASCAAGGMGAAAAVVYGTPVKAQGAGGGGEGAGGDDVRSMPTVVRGAGGGGGGIPATPPEAGSSSISSALTPLPRGGRRGGSLGMLARGAGSAKLQAVQAHSQAAAASLLAADTHVHVQGAAAGALSPARG